MLKDIKKNKIFWVVIAAAVIILIAIVVGILVGRDSKESGKPNTDVGAESDKSRDDETGSDNSGDEKENDKLYEGSGLEVGEDGETPMESIDASGSWDNSSDSVANGSDTNDDKKPDGDKSQEGSQQGGSSQGEPDGDSNSGVSDGDVLEGGSWTKPR